jgi:hypothetical protein
MGDYTVVAAALAGAVAGVLLMRVANAWSAPPAPYGPQSPAESSTPTGYARPPTSTAGPILLAVGLALLGVGLAIGSGDAGMNAFPLVPGAVVLVAALAATVRRGRSDAAAGQQASGEENAPSAGRDFTDERS